MKTKEVNLDYEHFRLDLAYCGYKGVAEFAQSLGVTTPAIPNVFKGKSVSDRITSEIKKVQREAARIREAKSAIAQGACEKAS